MRKWVIRDELIQIYLADTRLIILNLLICLQFGFSIQKSIQFTTWRFSFVCVKWGLWQWSNTKQKRYKIQTYFLLLLLATIEEIVLALSSHNKKQKKYQKQLFLDTRQPTVPKRQISEFRRLSSWNLWIRLLHKRKLHKELQESEWGNLKSFSKYSAAYA